MYLGSYEIDEYLTFYANTHRADTGAATDDDDVPAYRIYEEENGTPLSTGSMAKLDDANTTGFYSERTQLPTASGFEKGKTYVIYIKAEVNSVIGTMHHTFQINASVTAKIVSDKTDYILNATQTGVTIPTVTEVTNEVTADMTKISGDATAANDLELLVENCKGADHKVLLSSSEQTSVVIPTVTTTGTASTVTDGAKSAELAKVPKSDSNVTFNATALGSINAEVDTALNTAVPETPTAHSINERVKAIDDLTQASGGGDLADIKGHTDNIPASPAAVGSAMNLAADAIKAVSYDESTAFPIKSVDTGATKIARTGADGDTLEDISDEIHDVSGVVDTVMDTTDDIVSDIDTYIIPPLNKLNTALELDGAVYRLTENALEEGPGGGDATEAKQDEILVDIVDIKGSGFVKDTDSLVDLFHTGADGDTGETLSDQLDSAGAVAGAGSETVVYTLLTDPGDVPIADADVWVSSDIGGTPVLASGKTDQYGKVTFYLDPGTVYVFRQKSGYNFDNPDTEVVTA